MTKKCQNNQLMYEMSYNLVAFGLDIHDFLFFTNIMLDDCQNGPTIVFLEPLFQYHWLIWKFVKWNVRSSDLHPLTPPLNTKDTLGYGIIPKNLLWVLPYIWKKEKSFPLYIFLAGGFYVVFV